MSWVVPATELTLPPLHNVSEERRLDRPDDVLCGARLDGVDSAGLVDPLASPYRRQCLNLHVHERGHAQRPLREQFLFHFGGDRAKNSTDKALRHIVPKRDPPDDLRFSHGLRLGHFHRPPWTLFHGRGHGRGRGRD